MDNDGLFFIDTGLHFFAPLTGKYREVVASCIRNLYQRLNGPEADYSYHLTRKDVVDIFSDSIRTAPVMAGSENGEEKAMSCQERAGWMLRRLKEAGWIEQYMDSGKMQTAYRFTARGRRFAAPFAQYQSEIITNTQHTRSTLSHLKSFLNLVRQGVVSVGDLMIATKLSGEIISDFNEIIEDIVEQRRKLVLTIHREIQAAKALGDDFFEFMEKRIVPDISVRFSQDSVERYKTEILNLIDEIRKLPDGLKAQIEAQLRSRYPSLHRPERPSILIWALTLVEQRVSAACDVKMPELRAQTESFIRRAHLLINHLAVVAFGETESASVFSLVKRLSDLSADAVDAVLADRQSRHPRLRVAMLNPEKVVPPQGRKRREIVTELAQVAQTTAEERRIAAIRQRLADAFQINQASVNDYVVAQLADGNRIDAASLQVDDVSSLLGALHAPMIGSASGGLDDRFRIVPVDGRVENAFFNGSNFYIETIEETGESDNTEAPHDS